MAQIHEHSNAHYKQSLTGRANIRRITHMSNRRNVSHMAASIPAVSMQADITHQQYRTLKTVYTRQYKRAVNIDLYLCLLELKRMIRMC